LCLVQTEYHHDGSLALRLHLQLSLRHAQREHIRCVADCALARWPGDAAAAARWCYPAAASASLYSCLILLPAAFCQSFTSWS
jgi:hypothetical protein